MVQAFRRPQSPFEAAHFKLRDLEPTARYRVTNFDEPGTAEMTGRELMEDGLPVVLKRAPQSAIIAYKQVDGRQ
jgi:hypothetical protein